MSVQEVRGLNPATVEVTLRGEMPLGVDEYASEKIAHATRVATRHVRSAAVVVRHVDDPVSPYRVEASVDLDGALVRAEGVGHRPREAVDVVVERLVRRLTRVAERWDDRHAWFARRRDPRTEPRPVRQRPADERQVARRKSFAIGAMQPAEAAFDLEALGHDFYLFVEESTGADALLHHRDDGRYGLAGLGEVADLPESVVAEPDPPQLTEEQALRRLTDGGEPFVFYRDAGTDRGHVAYRRHDGHYGVITPA